MLSIILPTYNEEENILATIKEIKRELDGIRHEIIVVDDDSPDMTWKTVQDAKLKHVRCIRRRRRVSLSAAVILGFSRSRYGLVAAMDADGQHDPKILKEMLAHIKDHDIVIGSRFVEGGGIEGWSRSRYLMSRIAAHLADIAAQSKLRDPMSGFFMIKRDTFNSIRERLKGKGYKILLEIVLALETEGRPPRVHEVPLRFRLREKGESKLGIPVIREYISMLLGHTFMTRQGLSRLFKNIIIPVAIILVIIMIAL